MRSLRSRLVLGSALIAVVPLAVAMVFVSQRVTRTVGTQAETRLTDAMAALRSRLDAGRDRATTQLRILGNDATLKRLLLVRGAGGRDLADFLTERQVLLGLDYIAVADTAGVILAEGSSATAGTNAGLALAASAPIRYEGSVVGVVQGGILLDEAFLRGLERASGVELVLRDAAGQVTATTLAGVAPEALPPPGPARRVSAGGRSWLGQSFDLAIGRGAAARITGLVSTAAADQTNTALRLTAIALGLVGAALAVGLGLLWSRQVSRPVERLAAFSHRVAQGDWDEPLALQSVGELQTLVSALDRMRGDLRAYRDRLVTSERQAAWSQMARAVAHEVKNPLTPIAVSIADLRRSFEQEREDFPAILEQASRTIGEEIETLKRLLQEFSDFGRLPAPHFAPCRAGELLADLETLYGREVAAGRLAIAPLSSEITLTADAGQLRQALVNLVKNALEATAGGGQATLAARAADGALEVTVADTGPGLTAEQKAGLFAPGFTTKRHGSGLGLTIVERIVNDHRGTIAVDSAPGRGTTFRLRIPLAQET